MTQSPTGPPDGPPPWGNYPAPASQPPPPEGQGGKIALGAVIGFFATVTLPFAALGMSDGAVGGILVAILGVPVTGVALLFAAPTRPWGTGLLIGWTIALVVAAGACVAIFSSLS